MNKILVIIGVIMLILGGLLWYIGFTGMRQNEKLDIMDPEARSEYRTNKLISSAGVAIGIIGLLILALGAALGSKKETQQLYSQSQYSQQQPYQQTQYGRTQYQQQPYPPQTQEADNSRSCQKCGMRISIYDSPCPYCGYFNS